MYEYDYLVYVELKLSFIDLLIMKFIFRVIIVVMWDFGLVGWLWS